LFVNFAKVRPGGGGGGVWKPICIPSKKIRISATLSLLGDAKVRKELILVRKGGKSFSMGEENVSRGSTDASTKVQGEL